MIRSEECTKIILKSVLNDMYDAVIDGVNDFWNEQGEFVYKQDKFARRFCVRNNIIHYMRILAEKNRNIQIIEYNNAILFCLYEEFLIKVKSIDEFGFATKPHTRFGIAFDNNYIDNKQLPIPNFPEKPTALYLGYFSKLDKPETPIVSLVCPNGLNKPHWQIYLIGDINKGFIDISDEKQNNLSQSHVRVKKGKDVKEENEKEQKIQ